MKTTLSLFLTLFCLSAFGQGAITRNSITTNSDPVALQNITNIAANQSAIVGTNSTNFTLLIGLNTTNNATANQISDRSFTVQTSNGLYGLISTNSGSTNGITALTATNIANFQAQTYATNNTNYSLTLGANATNNDISISNSLYSLISGGGVNASTATNISAYQAKIATNSQLGTITNIAYYEVTNGGYILKMSPAGGNNELTDMFTVTNNFAGQFGYTEGNGLTAGAFWKSGNVGVGTNVWGEPIDFLGGINYVGNPYWYDIPASPYQNMYINWGYGPTKSRFSSAFPSPIGLYPGPATQPLFQMRQANPFAGISFFEWTVGDTNQVLHPYETVIGTNADGVKILMDQYGLSIGVLSDAYNPFGYTNAYGYLAQAANSYVILGNDQTRPLMVSWNGERPGDSLNGQAPFFIINPTNFTSTNFPSYSGFPLQRPNFWMPQQVGFPWALAVDENGGGVLVTNGSITSTGIIGTSTNNGAYSFSGNYDSTASFNVNGSAQFNSPASVRNSCYWSFDAAGARRLSFVAQYGSYTTLGHATGSPFTIAGYGLSDFSNLSINTTTTNQFQVDQYGNTLALLSFTSSGPQTNSGSMYISGNDFWPTNATSSTATINFTNRFSDITTNATFAFASFANQNPAMVQITTIYVGNTGGSTINVTPPANTITNGTWNVTNGGLTKIEFTIDGIRFTNGIATPLR